MKSHEYFLLHALNLAKNGRGCCAPNPSVGAVIVKDNYIIGEGYHHGPGRPHAEIEAFNNCKQSTHNAILYVTLEPCCHYGRTPPCTEAILKSGIKQVIYGYRDPNPVVLGKGAEWLSSMGISCEFFPLLDINEFYKSYHYWHEYTLPMVTAKIAMSLNGIIAGKKGERIQITDTELQKVTHEARRFSDAILTTEKTIANDDSKMNVRMNNQVIAKTLYIIDRKLEINPEATVFSTAKSVTLLYSSICDSTQIEKFLKLGIRCLPVNEFEGRLKLDEIISKIGADGVHDLWVEAGGTLLSSLLNERRVQCLFIYVSPKWISEGLAAFEDGFSLDDYKNKVCWQQHGRDAFCKIEFN